jgi:thioredoxin 1
MINRRTILTAAAAFALLTGGVFAADKNFYTPGSAERQMDAGEVVLLDFWASWCTTCAAQVRVMDRLRAENPAYDEAITFITVDWDQHAQGELARSLAIPRRSTLVAMKGRTEIGRIVAGTREADIKALLDAALAAR